MPDGIKYGEFIVSPCKLGIIQNVSQIPIISMEAKSGSVFHKNSCMTSIKMENSFPLIFIDFDVKYRI